MRSGKGRKDVKTCMFRELDFLLQYTEHSFADSYHLFTSSPQRLNRRTSASPTLSPALSAVSVPEEDDDAFHTKDTANGTPADKQDGKKTLATNGEEILSPSKTLKLTLKVTKSPVRLEGHDDQHDGQDEYADVNGLDQDEIRHENNLQDIELRKQPPTPTSAAGATIPASASHHRKPSIFGTATLEEDEQQDEADAEDAELSDVGDEPLEKDEQENGEDNMAMVDEERADESEAGEVDATGK